MSDYVIAFTSWRVQLPIYAVLFACYSDYVLWPGWYERSGIGVLLFALLILGGCGCWLYSLMLAAGQDAEDRELWREAMRAQARPPSDVPGEH